MADLVVITANVSPVWPLKAEIYPKIAAETVTSGQLVYETSAGAYGVADANGSGKQQARGVAICDNNTAGAGQVINVVKRGHVGGYTIPQAYDAQLFLSDTAGAVADAAGTMTVPVGRVDAMSDAARTKVVYFDFDWSAVRS